MARRLPDPPYTPPSDVELELGYWGTCSGCGRRWSQKLIDPRTRQCLPCAREWRRDDMASRRRGAGGVPLTQNPVPHPFRSKVLGREVDLNSEEARAAIVANAAFRDEVDGYIEDIVANNGAPRPPLRGVMTLLPRTKPRAKVERAEVVPNSPAPVDEEAEAEVDALVRSVASTIDGEIVEDS